MEQRGVAVAALGVLAIGPVAGIGGTWAPLAGVLAAAAVFAARFAPVPRAVTRERGRRLAEIAELLCATGAAAALARGFGDCLVPGHARAAAAVLLVLGALAVAMRARCPGVLVWFAAVLGGVAAVLFVGAGLGIAPAPHPVQLAQPWSLLPAAALLLAPVAAAPAGIRRGFPWWPLAGAAGFGLLAAVTVHQLGAARAALAPAPVQEALTAADAATLVPVLAVATALVSAVGVHGQLTATAGRVPVLAPTLGALVLTLPDRWIGLLACAVFAVLRWGVCARRGATGRGTGDGDGELT